MQRILNFLLSPSFIKAVGFLVLMIIVLLYVEAAGWVKVLLVTCIILLWVLTYIQEKQQASKGGAGIEKALWSQADVQSPALPGEDSSEAIRQKFQEAIAALKKARVGRRTLGSSALYALPWYMIIGPSAAGKTTAIRESEVESPVVDPVTGKKQKIKGVGGTRNCDWWFMNETILLDTAGRWVSGTEEEDKDEWLSFLRFLKKYRRRKPINGVIVAVSIKELAEFNERQVEEHAQTLRNRVNELIKELGLIFPIYLIFTKCDLLDGFVEMFGDLDKVQRSQVWGHTIRLDQRNELPEAIFEKGLTDLEEALNEFRFNRLHTTRNEQRRRKIFAYPFQLAQVKANLTHFVSQLFLRSPFLEKPLFRGFYFTSGTQEGNPIDTLAKGWEQQVGGFGGLNTTFTSESEKKSYFITDLLKKVIIPDQKLAGLSLKEKGRRYFSSAGIFILLAVLLGLFIFGISVSYRENIKFLNRVKELAAEVKQIPEDRISQPEKLARLDALRANLKKIEKTPFFMRLFGLKIGAGSDFTKAVRQIYFSKATNLILDPVKKQIDLLKRESVNAVREQYISNYDNVKAYFMLGDSLPVDHTFLKAHLEKLVVSANDSTSGKFVRQQIEYYAENLDRKSARRFDLAGGELHALRQKLIAAREEGAPGKYAKIKAERYSANVPEISLGSILNSRQAEVVSNPTKVDGFFTKDGWENHVAAAIFETKELDYDPVLKIKSEHPDEQGRERINRKVVEYYFDDYAREWNQFLRNTRIRDFSGTSGSAAALEILSDPGQSPLYLILKVVSENTMLSANNPEQSQNWIQKAIASGKNFLRGNEEVISSQSDWLTERFRTIHRLIGFGEENQPGVLNEYLALLGTIYGQMQDLAGEGEADFKATEIVKGAIGNSGNPYSQAVSIATRNTQRLPEVRELLVQPVENSWKTVAGLAQEYVNAQWQSEVYEHAREFQDNFPFDLKSSSDAYPEAVEAFFGPEGIFWKFYAAEFKDLIDKRRGEWRTNAPEKLEYGIGFSERCRQTFEVAEKIRDTFFTGDALEFDFEIQPIVGKILNKAVPRLFVTRTRLSFNGQSVIYQNELILHPKPYTWPSPIPNDHAVLKIETGPSALEPDTEFNFSGYWALFRLIYAAERAGRDFTWTFDRKDAFKITVPFRFSTRSGKNPFDKSYFSNFNCPSRMN
jgi:type VI secretion system protein ImpL